jgi:hypothetical protein
MFIENKTLQLVLVKPNDMVTDKPIQAKELVPLLIEPKDFQHVEFEPVNNHFTPISIKTIDVIIHHYHIISFMIIM